MPESFQEKRAAPRRRVLKGARLVFNNGQSTIDCTVRNVSDTGALLLVDSSIGIPDQVQLLITSDKVSVPARVVRRTVREVAVKFMPA